MEGGGWVRGKGLDEVGLDGVVGLSEVHMGAFGWGGWAAGGRLYLQYDCLELIDQHGFASWVASRSKALKQDGGYVGL